MNPEKHQPAEELERDDAGPTKERYEPPRVEAIKLSEEAAEALT